jgi:hypothetical protein
MNTHPLMLKEQKKLKKNHNILIFSIWVFKIYLMSFGVVIAVTSKSSNHTVASIQKR